jgi:two-component sensor histidine kinase
MIDIPIIYLTAYGDEETLQKAKITEPHAYILKPFEGKGIKNAIEISLHKHKMELKLKNSLIEKEMLIKEISSNLQNNYNKITNLINSGFTERINENIGLQQEIEQNKMDNNELGIFQDDFAFVDFAQYVESLVNDLKGSYNLDPAVDINLNIENIMLDLDTSLSYGLIINELLKSSIKNLHFKKACSINIDFHLDNSKFILTINDNYNNYPEMLKTKNSSFNVINTLVKQHQGTIGFNEDKKSEIKVIFGIR